MQKKHILPSMNKIRLYRKQTGISQTQLATMLNWHQTDVSRAEQRLDAGIGLQPEDARHIENITGIPRMQLLYPLEFKHAS